jgi:hypothetical protein
VNIYNPVGNRRPTFSFSVIALLGISLAGCVSTAEKRQANFYEDDSTCDDFGARYGSPEYSQCMLLQQQRRDYKERDALEKTRITSEIAREGQIMADRARKQRCDRNPDRRECK